MSTDKVLYKEESQQIIGCAIEVGFGFHEKPYENALVLEFGHRNIAFEQQKRFPLLYKSVPIGEYVPDLIAFDKIIIDTKTIEAIGRTEIAKIMNYLRKAKLRLGCIINFKHPKLQWKRVVL